MAKEIKTFEERKKTLLEKGKQKGFITYEELADELRGLDVDSDSLDDLYNTLVDNHIEITSDENMEDEMSVTVIATGFASFDGGKKDNASASRMSMTSSRTEMLRNQAASVAAAKDVAARKTGNVDVADDDDTFYDIMSIFNRK